jgi:hypothetical protein
MMMLTTGALCPHCLEMSETLGSLRRPSPISQASRPLRVELVLEAAEGRSGDRTTPRVQAQLAGLRMQH